jgi:hypothetical protein
MVVPRTYTAPGSSVDPVPLGGCPGPTAWQTAAPHSGHSGQGRKDPGLEAKKAGIPNIFLSRSNKVAQLLVRLFAEDPSFRWSLRF